MPSHNSRRILKSIGLFNGQSSVIVLSQCRLINLLICIIGSFGVNISSIHLSLHGVKGTLSLDRSIGSIDGIVQQQDGTVQTFLCLLNIGGIGQCICKHTVSGSTDTLSILQAFSLCTKLINCIDKTGEHHVANLYITIVLQLEIIPDTPQFSVHFILGTHDNCSVFYLHE